MLSVILDRNAGCKRTQNHVVGKYYSAFPFEHNSLPDRYQLGYNYNN